jgi:hypothetical protein
MSATLSGDPARAAAETAALSACREADGTDVLYG